MRPGPATRAALLSRNVSRRRLPPGTEDLRHSLHGSGADARRGLRLSLKSSASILPWRRIRRRAQCPGAGSLDMNRIPRQLTLERVTGIAELWPAAPGNMHALWLGTLCRRCVAHAMAKCFRLVQKMWRGTSSCGKDLKTRPWSLVFRPSLFVPATLRFRLRLVTYNSADDCAPSWEVAG